MSRFVLSPSSLPARHLLHVEQAMRSLRRGEDVACRVEAAGECQDWSIVAVDGLEGEQFARFAADTASRLILAGPRARALGLPVTADDTAALRLTEGLDLGHLALIVDPAIDGQREVARLAPAPAAAVDGAAMELAKLAELLPAVLVRPAGRIERDALPASDILNYRKGVVGMVRRVSEANVPLHDHERTRIVAFRPGDGGPDHLALILGEPALDQPVLVRMHSSCVTGDLLGSLRCDCGDQLRGAIAKISQQGAGVLLYLSQEGRGIGIANKLRAYRLQDSGFDTVDANDQLGFATDERSYAVAAEILRQLGVGQVRLLTNNPEKLAALAQHGIDVVERVPHIFAPTEHSARYLAAKARRSGHLL